MSSGVSLSAASSVPSELDFLKICKTKVIYFNKFKNYDLN